MFWCGENRPEANPGLTMSTEAAGSPVAADQMKCGTSLVRRQRRPYLQACVWFAASAASLFAQNGPAVVSPEVHADHRVTLRVSAPKAAEVTFKGDWHNDALKMDKGADGVWSITVGPLSPSTYIYAFTVDGVTIADPINPRVKLRAR